MKKAATFLLFSIITILAAAQPAVKTIRINGTRLAFPLVQKWIDIYTTAHPELHFELNRQVAADSADILIVSHRLAPGDVRPNQTPVAVSRYVQLPVVSSRRSAAQDLQAKGFRQMDFLQTFFGSSKSMFSVDSFTVYKRQQPACASQAFANHFGNVQNDIKGIGVTGDDHDLLNAVKRDATGLSYNNLGFIYDLKTRKPIDSIAIVPLDLNENGIIDAAEKIYSTLDDVISFAETSSNKLPVENVYLLINATHPDKTVLDFVYWILKNDTLYNHAFGFLNLNENEQRHSEATLAALQQTHTETISRRN